jgi:hypothetical protein
MVDAWDERSDWMRKVGAVQCSWNDAGDIQMLVLGPAPAEEAVEEFSEEDRAREVIAAQRKLLLAATGGAKYRTGSR